MPSLEEYREEFWPTVIALRSKREELRRRADAIDETLNLLAELDDESEAEAIPKAEAETESVPRRPKNDGGLTENQRRVYDIMREIDASGARVTAKLVAERNGASRDATRDVIKRLQKKGLVQYEGSPTKGVWILKGPSLKPAAAEPEPDDEAEDATPLSPVPDPDDVQTSEGRMVPCFQCGSRFKPSSEFQIHCPDHRVAT